MAETSIAEFADRLTDIMSVITREFFKYQTRQFYNTRITMPQFVVMSLLQRQGETRMTDVAHFINVTTAAVTGLVDRLVRDRYAVRANDSDDRRIIRVKLTPKGEKLVADVIKQRRRIIIKMFSVISQEEREQYLKILERIRGHIQEGKG